MAVALVEANGVGRRYGQGERATQALCPVSFRVLPGERIALMGPSGSGKSTLLHLLADLDAPSEGELSWPGLGPRGTLRPSRIGMVFQVPSLLAMLSAVENVELPMRLDGQNQGTRAAAMAALQSVGLAGMEDKLPDELSGGQAQRVGIARALAHRPGLVLADEPTGQLDRATALRVFDALLAALEGRDAALVVATHDPAIAARLDVVWEMSHGRLRLPGMAASELVQAGAGR